jgi:heme A synthase
MSTVSSDPAGSRGHDDRRPVLFGLVAVLAAVAAVYVWYCVPIGVAMINAAFVVVLAVAAVVCGAAAVRLASRRRARAPQYVDVPEAERVAT